MELPTFDIVPGDCAQGNWIDEVNFYQEVPIDDEHIDEVNELVCERFGITLEQIDWRDELTLWIHVN